MKPILTPETLDALLTPPPRARGQEDRIIWTAGSIARRLGCGEDYVRKTLARQPGTPIRKRGRRLYCFERELIDWMRDDAA